MGQGRPSTRGNNAYQPRTEIGENNIPVTDSTVSKTNLDYPVRPRGNERGKFKFKFKMPKLPKLKFSGSGPRTAMKGKMHISKTSGSYGKTFGKTKSK